MNNRAINFPRVILLIISLATALTAGGPAAASDAEERAAFKKAMQGFLPAMDAQDNHGTVDFTKLRPAMDEFWAAHPDTHSAQTLLTYYMDMFAKAHPDIWHVDSNAHNTPEWKNNLYLFSQRIFQ